MRYVLDCSTALQWVLPEPHAEAALAVLEQARNGRISLIAPDLIFAEFGHGLRKHVLGKRLPEAEAMSLWLRFLESGVPEVASSRELGERALALALGNMATFYDSLYIALAEREDLKVLTADEGMVNAFARLNRTIHLADYTPPGPAEPPASDDKPGPS